FPLSALAVQPAPPAGTVTVIFPVRTNVPRRYSPAPAPPPPLPPELVGRPPPPPGAHRSTTARAEAHPVGKRHVPVAVNSWISRSADLGQSLIDQIYRRIGSAVGICQCTSDFRPLS